MGHGLIAYIVLLAGENHQSVRQIKRLLAELWQLDFSTGAISAAQGKASEAMVDAYADIGATCRNRPWPTRTKPVFRAAAAGTRARGGCGWCLTTTMASYFGEHVSRGKKAAAGLLGNFIGVPVTGDDALERGARLKSDKRTRCQCQHLLKCEPMVWTFLTGLRIPLSNNLAERILRPYVVIGKKLAFGSHSRRGDAC